MNTVKQATLSSRPATAANDHRWLVMKFGGTSVSSVQRWETIRDLVRERQTSGYRPVVVHSALAGVSNRLQAVLTAAVEGDCRHQCEEIIALHMQL
ncbi:MAG: hypothetical protein QF483_09470, partial [Gammaproteobacteria bacterium]|nr:hypothetical protein [Gammaproteobacteria bacterium]